MSRARQVPGTAEGIREGLAAELRGGRRDRIAEPAVETEYGIKAVTARIDGLYERLAAPRSARRRTAGRESALADPGPSAVGPSEMAPAAGTTHN